MTVKDFISYICENDLFDASIYIADSYGDILLNESHLSIQYTTQFGNEQPKEMINLIIDTVKED